MKELAQHTSMGRKRIAAGLLALGSFIVLGFFGWGRDKIFDWLAVQAMAIRAWPAENVWGFLGIAGIVSAIAMFFWPTARGQTREQRLADDVARTLLMINSSFENAWIRSDYDWARELAQANALRVSLEKLKFRTPVLDRNQARKNIHLIRQYLVVIEPLMQRGHFDEARESAIVVCSEIADL